MKSDSLSCFMVVKVACIIRAPQNLANVMFSPSFRHTLIKCANKLGQSEARNMADFSCFNFNLFKGH